MLLYAELLSIATNTGLTKLEYAIIHCNVPAPEWFKPKMPEKPKHPGYSNDVFGKVSNHPNKELYIKYFNDETEDWHDPENKVPIELKKEVKNHLDKFEPYLKLNSEWEEQFKIQKIVQWKVYYSNSLLDALTKI